MSIGYNLHFAGTNITDTIDYRYLYLFHPYSNLQRLYNYTFGIIFILNNYVLQQQIYIFVPAFSIFLYGKITQSPEV